MNQVVRRTGDTLSSDSGLIFRRGMRRAVFSVGFVEETRRRIDSIRGETEKYFRFKRCGEEEKSSPFASEYERPIVVSFSSCARWEFWETLYLKEQLLD